MTYKFLPHVWFHRQILLTFRGRVSINREWTFNKRRQKVIHKCSFWFTLRLLSSFRENDLVNTPTIDWLQPSFPFFCDGRKDLGREYLSFSKHGEPFLVVWEHVSRWRTSFLSLFLGDENSFCVLMGNPSVRTGLHRRLWPSPCSNDIYVTSHHVTFIVVVVFGIRSRSILT